MNIFSHICESLRMDKRASLATIISAAGSAPAPAQSKMLIRTGGDGKTIGTVGGGCLDQDIILSLQNAQGEEARILPFDLNDDDSDTGLTCGGTVFVLLETIDASMLPVYESIIERRNAGLDSLLVTRLFKEPFKSLCDESGKSVAGPDFPKSLSGAIRNMVAEKKEITGTIKVKSSNEDYIMEHIAPSPRLIIFGGGHVGKVVSQCGAIAGFSVTLIDDRKQFANRDRFPEAERIFCESFDLVFQSLNVSKSDYIVIVTRGHKHDENILEKIAHYNPKYIGMIGSKRKIKLTYEHLATKGVPPDFFPRIHAPIGLDIGAETAEEIGVSIVAEIIAIRRNINNIAPTMTT
ncbi:MAG: XdhC family protein [Bacteroidota bacterium]